MSSHQSLLKQVFQTNDTTHKGYLNGEDVKVAITELFGYKPIKSEVDDMLHSYGCIEDQHSTMNLEQFSRAMVAKLAHSDEVDRIRHTFHAFDSQCRGFLTFEDVKKAFEEVAPHLPVHRVAAAFKEIDQNADGRVSYKDFEYMMSYSTSMDI